MFPADLVTFTVEILNGKLHFLCSVRKKQVSKILQMLGSNLFNSIFADGKNEYLNPSPFAC